MSVKKTIEQQFLPLYKGFDKIAREIHLKLDAYSDKLDDLRKPRNSLWVRRVLAVRNWLTHYRYS